jgi:hypothetical protein
LSGVDRVSVRPFRAASNASPDVTGAVILEALEREEEDPEEENFWLLFFSSLDLDDDDGDLCWG